MAVVVVGEVVVDQDVEVEAGEEVDLQLVVLTSPNARRFSISPNTRTSASVSSSQAVARVSYLGRLLALI